METGRVIDRSHPQCGTLIGGYCLVVPTIRGSGGTPGNLAMTLKLGVGPAGIVIVLVPSHAPSAPAPTVRSPGLGVGGSPKLTLSPGFGVLSSDAAGDDRGRPSRPGPMPLVPSHAAAPAAGEAGVEHLGQFQFVNRPAGGGFRACVDDLRGGGHRQEHRAK